MIRAFVAIALPEAVRFELMLVSFGLPAPRPVPPENLHLTLLFLGDLPEPTVADVDAALRAVRAPGFSVGFSALGLFGGARPRLVYAGVAGSAPLCHLQAKVESAVRGAGVDVPARRYVPHVTLARLPASGVDRSRIEQAIAGRAGTVAPGFRAEDFRLYRSRLGSGGAAYEELARYPLD